MMLVMMGNADEPRTTDEEIVSGVLRDFSARGYPLTRQRRDLVSLIVSARMKSFTADELLQESNNCDIKIGRATLFRTLDRLVQLGYLNRVANDERKGYVVCRPGHHHHHLTCSECGEVVHFSECPAAALLGTLESETGYRIDRHSLEFSGTCPACQHKQ